MATGVQTQIVLAVTKGRVSHQINFQLWPMAQKSKTIQPKGMGRPTSLSPKGRRRSEDPVLVCPEALEFATMFDSINHPLATPTPQFPRQALPPSKLGRPPTNRQTTQSSPVSSPEKSVISVSSSGGGVTGSKTLPGARNTLPEIVLGDESSEEADDDYWSYFSRPLSAWYEAFMTLQGPHVLCLPSVPSPPLSLCTIASYALLAVIMPSSCYVNSVCEIAAMSDVWYHHRPIDRLKQALFFGECS